MANLFCAYLLGIFGFIAFYGLWLHLKKYSKILSDERIGTVGFSVFICYLTWIFIQAVILFLK